uniref:Secreted protein n=1 Tax=Knipowitschia caucasica TaxID=637954 RepID=A0AAV2M0N9_KNICA
MQRICLFVASVLLLVHTGCVCSERTITCGDHVQHLNCGQKSDDPLSPDYVPSVFAHTKSPARRRAVQSLEKFKVRQNLKKKKLLLSSRSEAAMALPNFSSEMSEMTTQLTENDMPEGSIG